MTICKLKIITTLIQLVIIRLFYVKHFYQTSKLYYLKSWYYMLISRPQKHKKGGGVAILVNNKIKHQIREDLTISENKNFESVLK